MQLIDLISNIFLNHFWSFGSGSGRWKFHSKSIVIRITPILPVFSAIYHPRSHNSNDPVPCMHLFFNQGVLCLKFKSQNNEQHQTTPCQQYNWILIPIIWSFLLQFKFSLFNFQFYSFDFEFTTQFWSFADKFRNLLSSTDESLKPVSRKPWGHS